VRPMKCMWAVREGYVSIDVFQSMVITGWLPRVRMSTPSLIFDNTFNLLDFLHSAQMRYEFVKYSYKPLVLRNCIRKPCDLQPEKYGSSDAPESTLRKHQ
jgi:hypothetical protein